MEITEIIGEDELKKSLLTDKPVLVDFYASWCAPCKMQAPIIYELANDLDGKIVIVKVDIDQNEKLAFKYGVESIPTMLVIKSGNVKEKSVGLTTKAKLSEMLIKYM